MRPRGCMMLEVLRSKVLCVRVSVGASTAELFNRATVRTWHMDMPSLIYTRAALHICLSLFCLVRFPEDIHTLIIIKTEEKNKARH